MQKTAAEKLDYIYNHIKRERSIMYTKIIIKVIIYMVIIGGAYYFYTYRIDAIKKSIIESIRPNISSNEVVNKIKGRSKEIMERINKLREQKKESTNNGEGSY